MSETSIKPNSKKPSAGEEELKLAKIEKLESTVSNWTGKRTDVGVALVELYQVNAHGKRELSWAKYVREKFDMRRSLSHKLGRSAVVKGFFEENTEDNEALPSSYSQFYAISTVAGFKQLEASEEGLRKALRLWRTCVSERATAYREIEKAIKDRKGSEGERTEPELPSETNAEDGSCRERGRQTVVENVERGLSEVSKLRKLLTLEDHKGIDAIERALKEAKGWIESQGLETVSAQKPEAKEIQGGAK